METIYQYLIVFITAIFINNVVLSQILGICPFLGVSKKINTALGMAAAVAFVLVLATLVTYLLQYYVLDPYGLGYMQTIAFILVIAALVQMVEIILKKVSPSLYQALGVFLPLITTNCAVLGVALDNISAGYTLIEAMVAGLAVPIGFTIVIYVFATIRERLEIANVPESFKGTPIALITAGIMACAIAGIAGLVLFPDSMDDSYYIHDFYWCDNCSEF